MNRADRARDDGIADRSELRAVPAGGSAGAPRRCRRDAAMPVVPPALQAAGRICRRVD